MHIAEVHVTPIAVGDPPLRNAAGLRAPCAVRAIVELDRQALARFHENYRTCGLTHRDDEVEMQEVEPGWTFRATRW